jgi:Tol biopolymer transport system component
VVEDEVPITFAAQNALRTFQQQAAAENAVERAELTRQLSGDGQGNGQTESSTKDTVVVEIPEGMTAQDALEAALAKARRKRETTKEPVDDIAVLNERVNVSSERVQGNGSVSECTSTCVSADGRYVTFASSADNLVPDDTNSSRDIFVRDRIQGTITRVSVASDGTEGDSSSGLPVISADGRYVAFSSDAKNFAKGNRRGIYLHDRDTGETISVIDKFEWSSTEYRLSASGRFVAYSFKDAGVFLYDHTDRSTQRVDPVKYGDEQLYRFQFPTVSSDGRFVAFVASGHIHFVDLQTKLTTRITHPFRTNAGSDYSNCEHLTMSPDGRYLAFTSNSAEWVPRDTNGMDDVFLYDHQSRKIERVSRVAREQATAQFPAFRPTVTEFYS